NSSTSSPLIYGDFDSDHLRLNANVGIGYTPYDSYSLVVKGGTTNSLRVYEDVLQTYALYVSGDAYATGNWYIPSDQNLKTNILTYQNAVEDLLKIRGVKFKWNIDEKSDVTYPEGDQFGVIAQEVVQVFPELVKKDSEGKLAVAYANFTPILIEAIKEQQKMIEELQERIAVLEEKNE
ncbi:MAG: tail fiber domain-containing protein, partial [Bacteroidales bacterium]|nr:tail fiber domain-containing protein [Bacteroidales bacterium]